jgi:hypothetical protein
MEASASRISLYSPLDGAALVVETQAMQNFRTLRETNVLINFAHTELVFATKRQPSDDVEPIQQQNILLIQKLTAEGTIEEVQMVLGWLLDTEALLVLLPPDKFVAWLADMIKFIKMECCNQEHLDTMVRCLNHANMMLPFARHFLGRIQARLDREVICLAMVNFDKKEIKDLQIWEQLLTRMVTGRGWCQTYCQLAYC